ncbi:MAG: Lrp/AsnC family transcriptional regulator [Gulosibacter sp.]|uniref:Lrp/AsnC family transcriptional regulator n=1 Tax=Gulosibacter sp. TaxID=2817531 RepID=UPI003F8DE07B
MPEAHADLDERLIAALTEDPRASVLALSRTTGFSRAAISSRLHEMIESADIRIVGVVHPQLSGHGIMAHISVSTNGPIAAILDQIQAREETVFLTIVAGAYDFVFEYRVRTHEELYSLIADVRADDAVSRVDTLIYSTVVKGYLEEERFTPIPIDSIDRQLLEELQIDGRMSWQLLAESVELSPSAARARVHRMLDAGIAQITVLRERSRYGQVLTCGVGLTLSADALQVLPDLRDKLPIDFAVATIGRFDALVTIRTTSLASLHEALESIRAHSAVRRVEAWTHLQAIKEDFTRRL